MDQSGAAEDAGASAARHTVALRGELWQRHARLRELDPADPEYDEAVNEVLDLTSELLTTEAEAAQAKRLAWHHFGRVILACLATVLLGAVILLALTTPWRGALATRWALALLLLVTIGLLATLIVRWRRHRNRPRRTATNPVTSASTDAVPSTSSETTTTTSTSTAEKKELPPSARVGPGRDRESSDPPPANHVPRQRERPSEETATHGQTGTNGHGPTGDKTSESARSSRR